jgi:hypothetical protein
MKPALLKGSTFVCRTFLVLLVCVTLGTSGCGEDPKEDARWERLKLPHPAENIFLGIPHE